MAVVHPFSVDAVLSRLVDDPNFRTRLAFECGDEDVIVQARDLTFLTHISDFPSPVRVLQNNKLKWIDANIIIKTRYLLSGTADNRHFPEFEPLRNLYNSC
jgi:hypothetical protein